MDCMNVASLFITGSLVVAPLAEAFGAPLLHTTSWMRTSWTNRDRTVQWRHESLPSPTLLPSYGAGLTRR